jgi:hypothetical protein
VGARGAAAAAASCACVRAEQPCFSDCPASCAARNPFNDPGLRVRQLSDCALDHLSVLRSLSSAQLRARYPLACIER